MQGQDHFEVEQEALADLSPATILRSMGFGLSHDLDPAEFARFTPIDAAEAEWGIRISRDEEDAYLVSYRPGHAIVIEPEWGRFRIAADISEDAPLMRHFLLDDALPRMLSHRGTPAFHMGGIRLGTGAIALAGRSGAGKSTLTAALLQAGGQLLSDDCVLIDHRTTPPMAWSPYPGLRLWPRSVEGLALSHDLSPHGGGPEGKLGLEIRADEFARGRWPLEAIYLVQREPGRTEPAIETLSRGEGAFALIDNAFGLDIRDAERSLALFEIAVDIARRIPVRRLCTADDLTRVPATVALLHALHGVERD